MKTSIHKMAPISPVPEEDYCMGKSSVLTIECLIKNGMYEDYKWLRECFARYARFNTAIKPYHSSFFVLFQTEMFRNPQSIFSNIEKRRTLNFIKKSIKANLQITDILLDDTRKVVFAKTRSHYTKPEEFPIIKSLKGAERVVKQFVTVVSTTMEPLLVNIGGGNVNMIPDSENYDIALGKNINKMSESSIEISSFVSLQSLYHIKPPVLHNILRRPFLATYTYIHKGKLDVTMVSGRIGNRYYVNEHNYHPNFLSKRGCFLYATSHHKLVDPPVTTILVCNHLKPPKHIPLKRSKAISCSVAPYVEKQKPPKMVDLSTVDRELLAYTDFYQTHKLDGTYGKILFDQTSKRCVVKTKHGTIYNLDIKVPFTSFVFSVEILFDVLHRKAEIYLSSCENGGFLWEDVENFLLLYPMLGIKDYYRVPRGKTFRIPPTVLPTDGVVYIPVLYTSSKMAIDQKTDKFSFSHYYFKPMPTFDVSYEYVKSLMRQKRDVFLFDKEMIKKDKKFFQAHGEFYVHNPFIYELSVDNSFDPPQYIVHHLRVDKKNVQDPFVNFSKKPPDRALKGCFYYTQYADSFVESRNRFLTSFSDQRRVVLPLEQQDRNDFYASVLSHLVSRKQPVHSYDVVDMHTFLLQFFPTSSICIFITMALKSTKVLKTYSLVRMDKVNCNLTFFYVDDSNFYDLRFLFEEPVFTKPLK